MSTPTVDISVDLTPNPRSRKFILDQRICQGEAIVYRKSTGPFEAGPMVQYILELDHVQEILLRANILTVSQDGTGSWYLLENMISTIIQKHIATHDPTYTPPPVQSEIITETDRPPIIPSPLLTIIGEILDETVTPYIDAHGGALTLISFDPDTHRLTIFYQGACSTCPSSFGMTLSAIQNILREQFDPILTVSIANPTPAM
jgi:NFU1 iron-sulfur cluster scaffold homolog, mitochondrial